ncbi:MAG: hypothetical protein IH630_06020 [Thermoplasmata archaeon]|nr:hypothetical protein [Thermoplasmata archaeon]MCJ7562109.1 hypothetical protein [Thermoplasmata archaeon]TFG69817.1 MAG: hypothetical protein E4H25_03905 [Methanomassiliicoccus sp.]
MQRDVKIETLIALSAFVFVTLAVTMFLVPFEDNNTRIFFVSLAAVLVSINIAGFFMVWSSSPTIVDEIFLMTPDGRLLKHYTRRLRPDQDEDILAGMLTAVQNFIRESFDESGGRLKEIRFEHYDIVISHSKNVVIAAIISTKKPEKLRMQLTMVTDDLEKHFGSKLKNWAGDKADLTGVDIIMKKLLSGRYRKSL